MYESDNRLFKVSSVQNPVEAFLGYDLWKVLAVLDQTLGLINCTNLLFSFIQINYLHHIATYLPDDGDGSKKIFFEKIFADSELAYPTTIKTAESQTLPLLWFFLTRSSI